jgi:serine/threonine-protein kinase HipA
VDLKAHVLTTNIDLDEGTCSISLLESAAGYFALSLADARSILRQVADATSRWREVARGVGAKPSEMDRMASAFEHDVLRQALACC